MRIGELAKRAGVTTSRIRFYESRGLLRPAARRANGYRDYSDDDLRVVTFIVRGRSLGFTLRDVATHLRSPRGPERKARLQAQLETKLAQLDAHIVEMQSRRAVIRNLIREVRHARGAPVKSRYG